MNHLQKRNAPTSLFHEFESLQDDLSKLFRFGLSPWGDGEREFLPTRWAPAIDLEENDNEVTVKADLPGLAKDDIKISFDDDMLVIRGQKNEKREEKKKNFLRTERFSGSFYRAISLSSSVDASKTKAVYRNGVLEVTLPKREDAKRKQIDIKVE